MQPLIIAGVSFLLGYFAEKIMDCLVGRLTSRYLVWRTRRRVGRLAAEEHRDILITCSGVPCFAAENIRIEQDGARALYLAPPSELLAQMPESAGAFHREDQGLEQIGLPGRSREVQAAVEAARRAVGEKFIRREDGLYFNGEKYGIDYSDGFSRTTDAMEQPILTLRLFQTDYFTHRVLDEAARKLRILPEQLSLEALNGPLRWLRASYGLSILVVLGSSNQIIMTHRTRNASFSEGKSWIYVSATEAFSPADDDPYIHRPDLLLCLQRGILEELGIPKEMYSRESIRFYDAFFETHFLQDGLVAAVTLKKEVTFDKVRALLAKDKQLEVEKLFLLQNERQAIERFIEANQGNMRSQTVFALKSHAARL